MGSYISNNISAITSTTTTNNTRNANTKKKKSNFSNNLASYFYIGGKKHDLVATDQSFLFGDRTDLNFIFTNKPVKVSRRKKKL